MRTNLALLVLLLGAATTPLLGQESAPSEKLPSPLLQDVAAGEWWLVTYRNVYKGEVVDGSAYVTSVTRADAKSVTLTVTRISSTGGTRKLPDRTLERGECQTVSGLRKLFLPGKLDHLDPSAPLTEALQVSPAVKRTLSGRVFEFVPVLAKLEGKRRGKPNKSGKLALEALLCPGVPPGVVGGQIKGGFTDYRADITGWGKGGATVWGQHPDALIERLSRGWKQAQKDIVKRVKEGKSGTIQQDPVDASAWRERAMAKVQRRDFKGAEADLTRALEIDPQTALYYHERSWVRTQLRNIDGALADLDRAIGLRPTPLTHAHRANLRKARKDLPGAIADYERATELQPGNAAFWNNLADLRNASGDRKGAIRDLSRSAAIDPKQAITWFNRGAVRRLDGDLDGAIQDLTRAMEMSRDLKPSALLERAAAYRDGDQRAKAIADYERYLKIKPQGPMAKKVRERIAALRDP